MHAAATDAPFGRHQRMQVRVGGTAYTVVPLMHGRGQDGRTTARTVCEERAVPLAAGRAVGGGYLEMTGYRRKVTL